MYKGKNIFIPKIEADEMNYFKVEEFIDEEDGEDFVREPKYSNL